MAGLQAALPMIGSVRDDDLAQLGADIRAEVLSWRRGRTGHVFGAVAVFFVVFRAVGDMLDQTTAGGGDNGSVDGVVAVIAALLGLDGALLVGQQGIQPPSGGATFRSGARASSICVRT